MSHHVIFKAHKGYKQTHLLVAVRGRGWKRQKTKEWESSSKMAAAEQKPNKNMKQGMTPQTEQKEKTEEKSKN